MTLEGLKDLVGSLPLKDTCTTSYQLLDYRGTVLSFMALNQEAFETFFSFSLVPFHSFITIFLFKVIE